jgi:hypothetical protein
MSGYDQLLTLIEQQPLSRSLPAALRIANSITDEEWASWIKLELMGYLADNPAMREQTAVPEYRAVPGLWYDDYGRSLAINDPGLAFINELRLRQGVTELESIAAGNGPLVMRPMEFSDIIRNNFDVEVSIFQFQPRSVCQVLTNIKVRLLDRVASRRERISAIPENQISQKAEILLLKPNLYGVGVDLKALWRRAFGKQ